MFSKQLRRHGHEHGHGHGHRMRRHGERHERHGHSFRFPGHHMGHDSFRRRHYRGMRGFDFGECCSSENESPDETTQNVQGEKTVCERRHRWRHGRCCGDKLVPESAENKSDSAMNEGNVEPKDNNNATSPANPEAPILEKTGRFYCKHRRYLVRHLKDLIGNEKGATIAEGDKGIIEEECMRHHRGHHAGKRSRHHGRRCHSGESSSENESGKDQRGKHGHIRRRHHHHHHHGGKRGHRDCWKTFYGPRSDGESTDHEHTTDTEGMKRMFRGRHGGKFHDHHHRGWKGLRCYIIMVDSATNTESLEVPTSNQNESHPPTNPEVPTLVELIELGPSQETSQEEATSASAAADQVSVVADNLRKSSLE